jgi:hypothetical protein
MCCRSACRELPLRTRRTRRFNPEMRQDFSSCPPRPPWWVVKLLGRAPYGSRRLVAAAFIMAGIGIATLRSHAEIPDWMRDVEANGRFHDLLFRTVAMPGGPVEVRRSPVDAHDALTRAAPTSPGGAPDP